MAGLLDMIGRGGGGPENLWNGMGAPADANGYIPIIPQDTPYVPPPAPDGQPEPQFFNPGPNYAASPQDYSGPPPMDPQGAIGPSDTGMPTNWQDFKGNTSTGGGYFTFNDFYGNQGKDVPLAFQTGSTLPSTNNYRLLPPPYNTPQYIMRNGQIIDLNSDLRHVPAFGDDLTWRSGAGLGVPAAYAGGSIAAGIAGWPGSQSGHITWPAGS